MISRYRLIIGCIKYQDKMCSLLFQQAYLPIKSQKCFSSSTLNTIFRTKHLIKNKIGLPNLKLHSTNQCKPTTLQYLIKCPNLSVWMPKKFSLFTCKSTCSVFYLGNVNRRNFSDSQQSQDLINKQGSKLSENKGEIIERENIWTIPNLLCVSRIVLTPYLCYNVLFSQYPLALGLFVLAGFTDMLDGMIARTFPSQASKIGSFLDPLADKILVSSLFLTLTYVGIIPFLLTGVIVYRDVAIIAGASYVRYKSIPPPLTLSRYFDATHATAQLAPTLISKLNTALQLGLITSSLAAPIFAFTDHYLLHAYWLLTGLTTMISGVSYITSKDTYKILKDIKEEANLYVY